MVVRVAGVVLVVVAFVGLFARPAVAAEADAVPYFSADGNHDANQKIFATLRMPLPKGGLEFIQTPLEEIAAFLRDEYEIEIQIDIQALDDMGIDVTQPINASLRNLSLQSALKLILSPHELTYVVADEILLITTQEAADTRLSICAYPVRDLIDLSYEPTEAEKKSGRPAELVPIANTITSTIAADTWAESGKGGADLVAIRPGVLVISQTQAVHEEIRNALVAIRRAKQFALQSQAVPEGMNAMGMEGGYGDGMMGGGEYGEMRGDMGGRMMGRGGFGEEGGFGGARGGFGGEGGGLGGFGRPPKGKSEADDNPF